MRKVQRQKQPKVAHMLIKEMRAAKSKEGLVSRQTEIKFIMHYAS